VKLPEGEETGSVRVGEGVSEGAVVSGALQLSAGKEKTRTTIKSAGSHIFTTIVLQNTYSMP